MPTAHARVPTDRASRYLVQFCRHASQMDQYRGHRPRSHGGGGDMPPEVRHVAWSDTAGTVRLGGGRCVLEATEDALLLRVDAADEDNLQPLLDGITRRLVTIGRRDRLTVEWQRPDAAASLPPDRTRHAPIDAAGRRRRLIRTLLLAAAAALVIAVHLGLLGGALAASLWTRWAGNIVLAVIALKVITVSAHLLLGRFAIRRARGRKSPGHPGHEGARIGRTLTRTGGSTMTGSANCGRQIHMAAHALRAVRGSGLEKNGITFELWVVMEVIAETPGLNREQLIRRLAELTVHDQASADRAVDALLRQGLLATGADGPGTIELTAHGQALSEKVISTRGEMRKRLYDGISPEDFAITQRVLDLITQRARALHAGQ